MVAGMKYISTDKDTQFIETLAQNAISSISLDMPSDWQIAGIQKCVISEMMLQCTQGGLDLEIIFWRTSGYDDSDMDIAKIINRISLTEGTDGATQIAGANQYLYKNPLGQNVEFIDEDFSSKIHISLVNRDATTKNTAASGTVQLSAGAAGSVDSITVNGVECLSAAVPFNTTLDQTASDVKDNIVAYKATSGYTATVSTDTVTVLADSAANLGEIANGYVLASTATTITTVDTSPLSGALGNVVLTLGCTPYFC
jgi:hypothetical protein